MRSTAAPGVKSEEEGPGSAAPSLLREGQHVWVQHGRAQHAATIDALPPRHRPSKAGEGGFATIRWASNGAREEVDIEDIVPMHREGTKRARKRGRSRPYSPLVVCDSQWSLGSDSKKEGGGKRCKGKVVAKEVAVFSVGDRVKAKFRGWGKLYNGTIAHVLPDGRYGIKYDDGDTDESLSPGSIRRLRPENDCRKPSSHSTDGEVDTPPTKRRVKRRDETAAAMPECQSDHFSFPHLEYRQLCAYYMQPVTRKEDELPSGITLRKRTVLPSLIRSKNSAFRRKLHQRILRLERRGERKEVHRLLKALYDHDMDCNGVGDGPRALMDEILPGRTDDISLSEDISDESSDEEADSSGSSDSEDHHSNASNVCDHSDDDVLLRGNGIDGGSESIVANGHEISSSSGASLVKARALAALESSDSDESESEAHEGNASPPLDASSAEQAKPQTQSATRSSTCVVSTSDVPELEKADSISASPFAGSASASTMPSDADTDHQQLLAAVSITPPSDGVRVSDESQHPISIDCTSRGLNIKQAGEATSARATLIESSVFTSFIIQKRVVVVVMKPSKDATLGLEIKETQSQKGRVVSVNCIEPGSPFAGKLKAGMLLESVNGKTFAGLGECVALLKEAEGPTTISAIAATKLEVLPGKTVLVPSL